MACSVCRPQWLAVFAGDKGLQCFTSGTSINNYRWAATIDLSECIEVLPKETPCTVKNVVNASIIRRKCYELLKVL